ncbi:hypothetical protein J7K24_00295 [bacterium]|nr:hypothetical protein [bacterium]
MRIYRNGYPLETFHPDYTFEPWFVFNENEVRWNSPIRLLYNLSIRGCPLDTSTEDLNIYRDLTGRLKDFAEQFYRIFKISLFDVFSGFLFIIIISGIGIIDLLIEKEKNYKRYFWFILGNIMILSFVMINFLIGSKAFLSIPIILISGLYLRIFDLKYGSL